MENQNEVEINLLDLFHYLKKKILIVLLACVICACGAFLVSKLLMTPNYTASTRVYVLNRSSQKDVVYSDFQISTQLLNDYKVLITGQNVTNEVIKKLGLNMGHGELASKISVTAPDNTRVLQISVTDDNPQRAADIANCVREVSAVQIQQIMAVDAVNIVFEAEVPTYPSSPNIKRNVVLGVVLGLAVSVGALTAVFVLDDTIRTEEDVDRYLGLSVLGVIPATDSLQNAKHQQSQKPLKPQKQNNVNGNK